MWSFTMVYLLMNYFALHTSSSISSNQPLSPFFTSNFPSFFLVWLSIMALLTSAFYHHRQNRHLLGLRTANFFFTFSLSTWVTIINLWFLVQSPFPYSVGLLQVVSTRPPRQWWLLCHQQYFTAKRLIKTIKPNSRKTYHLYFYLHHSQCRKYLSNAFA